MLIAPVNPVLTALAGATQTAKQIAPGQAQNETRRPTKPVEKQEKRDAQNPRYHQAGADSDGRMHADFKV